jgi:hypothetical protein
VLKKAPDIEIADYKGYVLESCGISILNKMLPYIKKQKIN